MVDPIAVTHKFQKEGASRASPSHLQVAGKGAIRRRCASQDNWRALPPRLSSQSSAQQRLHVALPEQRRVRRIGHEVISADPAGPRPQIPSATTRLSITALVDSLKASSGVSYIPYIRVFRRRRRTPAALPRLWPLPLLRTSEAFAGAPVNLTIADERKLMPSCGRGPVVRWRSDRECLSPLHGSEPAIHWHDDRCPAGRAIAILPRWR
jgi:hypothetical protein